MANFASDSRNGWACIGSFNFMFRWILLHSTVTEKGYIETMVFSLLRPYSFSSEARKGGWSTNYFNRISQSRLKALNQVNCIRFFLSYGQMLSEKYFLHFLHAWCNGGNTFPDEWKMSSWCQDPFKDGKRFPFPNQQYCAPHHPDNHNHHPGANTTEATSIIIFTLQIYLFLQQCFLGKTFAAEKKRLVSWVLLAGTQSREGCCKKWLPWP